MATDSQILANRENSKKSTGPVTPQGKVIASRNAVKTSLFARCPVVGPEQEAEFNHLVACMAETFPPATWFEEDLLAELADAKWRLLRARLEERSLYQNDYEAHMEDGVEWNYGQAYQRIGKDLDRLRGYQRRFERRYDKIWNELTKIAEQRRREAAARAEMEARHKRDAELAAATLREQELEDQLEAIDPDSFNSFVENSSKALNLPTPSAADIRAELEKLNAEIESRLTNRK